MEIKLIIKDQHGLHARPTSAIIQESNKFESEITISSGEKTGNLRSIISVMALGVKMGEEVTITAEGLDAEQALASIEAVMKEWNLI